MHRRHFLLATAALAISGCQSANRSIAAPGPGPDAAEHAATIAALAPPKRARPLVAILADRKGVETTDLMVPYGVLKRSALCDVVVVADEPGRVPLMPALAIEAETSFDAFDADHPDGPDYVIVPALHERDAPGAVSWISECADGGAIIAGVCAGALTLEAAGLLATRRATTHWWNAEAMQRRNPGMTWVRDRRYVADRGVATTTGVSASLPFSLALVEAMGGRQRAADLAQTLGAADWDGRHNSDAFRQRGAVIGTAAANAAAIWRHERLRIPVHEGVDEIALAFTADAWSRTYRSKAQAFGPGGSIRTRGGLVIATGRAGGDDAAEVVLSIPHTDAPARTLGAVLRQIEGRHGPETAHLIALQLEYHWNSA